MSKSGRVAIAYILDKSGSMSSVQDATVAGFNEFRRNQLAAPGEVLFWLTLFDTNVDARFKGLNLSEVQELGGHINDYRPDGMTALYDAVARTIDDMGRQLAAMHDNDRPERVLCVIHTDGQENSSREYRAEDVKKRIDHQRDAYKWEFLFLGADQDAWIAAGNIGIAGAATLSYTNNAASTFDAFQLASAAAVSYRSGGAATLASNDIRDGTTAAPPTDANNTTTAKKPKPLPDSAFQDAGAVSNSELNQNQEPKSS